MKKLIFFIFLNLLMANEPHFFSDNNKTFYIYKDKNKTALVKNWQFILEKDNNKTLLFNEVSSLNEISEFGYKNRLGLDFLCNKDGRIIITSLILPNIAFGFSGEDGFDVKISFNNKRAKIYKFKKLNSNSVAIFDNDLLKNFKKYKSAKISFKISNSKIKEFRFNLKNSSKALEILKRNCGIK